MKHKYYTYDKEYLVGGIYWILIIQKMQNILCNILIIKLLYLYINNDFLYIYIYVKTLWLVNNLLYILINN